MKTVLVTGGAGFIGSHLCEALVERGDRVICVDNFITGSRENLKNKNIKIIEHDIIETLEITEHIDQIYNLACPASPEHYQQNPIRTIKASTLGMINMLGLARKHGARFLQASTSEVYGDPRVHPQIESYFGNVNSFGPRSCYDEGKRVAEALCFEYRQTHDMEIRLARIFNTYGPRMATDDGRVVSNFIVAALRGEPLTIYGDGSQTRSFCYVSDMVAGLISLMESTIDSPVNLGNPNEFTIKDLANKIINFVNLKNSISHLPLPQDDPKQRKPDISLAKRELGWEPKVMLDEGLLKAIEYFK